MQQVVKNHATKEDEWQVEKNCLLERLGNLESELLQAREASLPTIPDTAPLVNDTQSAEECLKTDSVSVDDASKCFSNLPTSSQPAVVPPVTQSNRIEDSHMQIRDQMKLLRMESVTNSPAVPSILTRPDSQSSIVENDSNKESGTNSSNKKVTYTNTGTSSNVYEAHLSRLLRLAEEAIGSGGTENFQ